MFVGATLLDETHVLGVNPEVTGRQHLSPGVATNEERKRNTRSFCSHSAIREAAEQKAGRDGDKVGGLYPECRMHGIES